MAKSRVILALLVVLAGCSYFRRGSNRGANAFQTKLEPNAIATIGRPGSVLVQAAFRGAIPFFDVQLDPNRVRGALSRFLGGRGNNASQDNLMDFTELIVRDPTPVSVRGAQTLQVTIETGSSGSGMILTPDGHVVTNAHVVDLDETDLAKMMLAQQQVPDGAAQAPAVVEQVLMEANPAFRLPEGRRNRIRNEVLVLAARGANRSGLARAIRMLVPSRQNGRMVPQPLACQIVVAGQKIPHKDVAVLKCDTNGNLPTVFPAPDLRSVSVGDDLYVIGYPGPATYHPLLSKDSIVESSLTFGHVSALKTMAEGWTIIQTDAAVTHGNSGGPAFDSFGRAIGIVTFGTVDSKGAEVAGFNYVVPITVVNEFLRSGKVTPKMSSFSLAFNEASAALYAGDPAGAKEQLAKIGGAEIGGMYVRQLQEKMGLPATVQTAPVVSGGPAPRVPARSGKQIALYSVGALLGVVVLGFGFLLLRAQMRW